MKEWPLIIFTLATQLACGLTLAAAMCDAQLQPSDSWMRALAVAIFPVVAAGILASLAHLGRPLLAWRAVVNWRQSPFSREVALTAIFALLSLAYSGCWWMNLVQGRLPVGVAASVAGIAAVLSAALVYRIPAQPAWNFGWLPMSFVGTALLLGGLLPSVMISSRKGMVNVFVIEMVAGSVLLLVSAVWMFGRRGASRKDASWWVCSAAILTVTPMALAVCIGAQGITGMTPIAVFAAVLVISGATIARARLYGLAVEVF